MIPQAEENKTKDNKIMCIFEELRGRISKPCGLWLMCWVLEAGI